MQNAPAWEWSDLRYFLAVLREGSTLRAAEALGVNQTTCARRIAALESMLGLVLFDRTAMGYHPTAAAVSLRAAAEAVEAAANHFASTAQSFSRSTQRRFRVTASAFYADAVAAAVARFRETAPDALVEVDSTDAVRDLAAGEADLAIRGGFRPTESGLVARRLWHEGSALYCSKAYAERAGIPSMSDFASHPFAVLGGKSLEMMKAAGFGGSVANIVNSIDALIAALRSGAFVGLLPDTIAKAAPDLVRCFESPDMDLGGWLVFPERWRDDPDHALFRDLLAEEVRRRAGRGDPG